MLYGTRRPILDGLSKQGSVECTWVTEVGHEEEHSLTFAKCNVPIRSYSTPKKAVLSVEDIVLVSLPLWLLSNLRSRRQKESSYTYLSAVCHHLISLYTCCFFRRCYIHYIGNEIMHVASLFSGYKNYFLLPQKFLLKWILLTFNECKVAEITKTDFHVIIHNN